MKTIILAMAATIASGCASTKAYPTRSELQADPGSVETMVVSKSPSAVYAVIRDMTASCLENQFVRAIAEAPTHDGAGGSVALSTPRTLLAKPKILAMTTIEPQADGQSKLTIYSASEAAPKGLVVKYRRWLEGGRLTCTE